MLVPWEVGRLPKLARLNSLVYLTQYLNTFLCVKNFKIIFYNTNMHQNYVTPFLQLEMRC